MDTKRTIYHVSGILGGIAMTALPTYIALRDGGLVDMLMHEEIPLTAKIILGTSTAALYGGIITFGTIFSLASYRREN